MIETPDVAPDEAGTDPSAAPPAGALWPGDTGRLREPSRRALLQLLRGPYLGAERHPSLWAALLNDEPEVRSRLADLYLDLVIDHDAQIAFIRNVDADADADAPRVVRTSPLTFIATALLLHLRQQLLTAPPGTRVIVDLDEATDALAVYRGVDESDPAGFAKRIRAAWSRMIDYGVLAPTSTEGRYEISPVLRLVFGADQIAALRAEYARLAAGEGA